MFGDWYSTVLTPGNILFDVEVLEKIYAVIVLKKSTVNQLLLNVAVEPGRQGAEFAVSAEADEEAMGSQHAHQSVHIGFEYFYSIRFFSPLIEVSHSTWLRHL